MIRARPSVEAMAPYRPPTSGRRGQLRLDFNENTSGPAPRVLEALRAAGPDDLSIYPEYGEAYERFASHFGAAPAEVFLGNGSDGVIHGLFLTFVDPGDPVLALAPSYAMFRFYAELSGARIEEVSVEDDFSFPRKRLLERLVAMRPRVCLLADPNNPTGTRVPADTLCEALAAAPDTLFVLDQAYVEFADPRAHPQRAPNLVVTRTFSKAYGLAGLRLGVGVGPAEVVSCVRKAQSPYGVSTLSVLCALAALDDPSYVEGYVAQVHLARRALCDLLERRGVPSYPSEANFVLARLGPRCDAVLSALRDRGILVRDRRGVGHPLLSGCVRLGVGTMEETRRLINGLEAVI